MKYLINSAMLISFLIISGYTQAASVVDYVLNVLSLSNEESVADCNNESYLAESCEALNFNWTLEAEWNKDVFLNLLSANAFNFSSFKSETEIVKQAGETVTFENGERLPNIRELARLFDYATPNGKKTNFGLKQHQMWFKDIRVDLNNDSIYTAITDTNGFLIQDGNSNYYDPYIISSTIRHTQNDDVMHVMAIRARTGEIIGLKSDDLSFCSIINNDGTCASSNAIRGEHQPILAITVTPVD